MKVNSSVIVKTIDELECNLSKKIIKGHYFELKIYNVLVIEVETLTNGEQVVGSYEVEFNTTELPSGIYFHRLKIGNFIQTNKMFMMK